ncbi:MAG: ATP-binding protein [Woeseia sp.]
MTAPSKRGWGFQLDSHTWRADLLTILLRASLTLGVLVYGFSIYWAWQQAMWAIIAVDSVVLVTLAIVWWFDRLSYHIRALAVCVAIYCLGAMLLTVAGTVALIYLLGHTAITTLLLGQRAGLASVAINSLTIAVFGIAGLFLWETPPAGWGGQALDWALLAANFVLVASVIALVVGSVLGTLERALASEVAVQEALRERKRRLETLIDASPNGVLVIGADGALLEINRSGLVLLSSDSSEEVIGRPFEEFIGQEHRAEFRRFHEAVCAGRSGNLECDLTGTGKRTINVEIVSAPLPAGEDDTQHIAIARDVTTTRKLAEQLRHSQHLDAIGKLTGGVAHDFNNLLTVILGSTDNLLDAVKDDASAMEEVVATRAAAERGAILTQRLLAFSRQQALAPRPTHIGKLLRGMEPLLHRTLGDDIELAVNLDTDAVGDCTARVDPHQLENAVLNLCINARDAMPAGGLLTLEVTTLKVNHGDTHVLDEFNAGDYVVLSVTDTGEGMAPEVASRVFEPFFTTKAVGKGTGLGLSMVYGFVKQSLGQARIYSEPGHGTTVRLYLPSVDDETIDEAIAMPERNAVEGGSEHILVVEDNEAVLDLVTRQLQSLGYRTTTAQNGPEAVALLNEGTVFDLLFTDVVMPGGMNGRQLADEATRLQPGLPVLFTSGYTESAILRDGALPEGTALLSKPYRRADLASKIRELLSSAVTQPHAVND